MSWRAWLFGGPVRGPSKPASERSNAPSSTIEISFDGSSYRVRRRRHPQARRYTLRVDAPAREVMLTMPARGNLTAAREFAQKNGGWIAARLARIPKAEPFAHGIEVPLRGIP